MKKIALIVVVLGLVFWWLKDPSIHAPSSDVDFDYIVKYPGNANSSDKLPMLVALHGDGDTVDNFYETGLNEFELPMRLIIIKAPFAYSSGSRWPWTPEQFDQYGPGLNEAIELLTYRYPTIGTPVLMGFSGGAVMSYYQAALFGKSYSYIFPISGRLNKTLLGDAGFGQGANVFSFHGRQDNVVSFSSGSNASKLLQQNGITVIFTEFDGGHLGFFRSMKSEITTLIEDKLQTL